jgi:hypothetical protein
LGPRFNRGEGETLGLGKQAGGLEPVAGAEPSASVLDALVDGVLGDAQTQGDLLGRQVAVHQPQAFAFARRQELDTAMDPRLRHESS